MVRRNDDGIYRKHCVKELLKSCNFAELEHTNLKTRYRLRDVFCKRGFVDLSGRAYHESRKVIRFVHYLRHIIRLCYRMGAVADHDDYDRECVQRGCKLLRLGKENTQHLLKYLEEGLHQ